MDVNKIAFVLDNKADDGSLLATPSPVATLPVSNLKKTNRSYVFRTTSTADQSITGNLAGGQPLSAFVLSRHNITGTVRLRLYPQNYQQGTVLYDSTALSAIDPLPWGSFVWGTNEWGLPYNDGLPDNYVLFFDSVLCASFQIDIVDASNADGYFEVNRLFLGQATQVTYNMSWGASLKWEEDTKQIRTDGGTLYSEPSLPYRKLKFNLQWLTEDDRAFISEKLRTVGKRKDIFVSAYPDNTDAKFNEYSFVGKFSSLPSFTHIFNNNFSSDYEIEEC